MKFSQSEAQPAEYVNLNVEASPHSTYGVLVIDQSVRSLPISNELAGLAVCI